METTSEARSDPVRVLLVEDDDALRGVLESVLSREGYRVDAAEDAAAAFALVPAFRPDIVILDVRLPGEDGFEFARRLRSVTSIPLVFLTAADSLEDRLQGFGLGADDYLVKPFAVPELLARLKVVVRRAGLGTSPTIEVRDLVIDESTRRVVRAGVEIPVTRIEFQLLSVLAKSPGTVFSKAQLLALVWGFDEYDPNLVEVHVSALRKKVEAVGPRLVETEYGIGYVLRA